MRLGSDILIDERSDLLKGKRIGVLAHAASVNGGGLHTVDRIARQGSGTVVALFGPEHGLATRAEDMEPVESHTDPASGLPVISLYGKTLDSLKPTQEMLCELDVFICDLQDVGSRYYTYAWTACLCAEACAEAGKKLIVCDRPNPIGGVLIEGAGIEAGFESFVGLFSLPVRHGMTIGEIVQHVNQRQGMGGDVEIMMMEGWNREKDWRETGLAWVNPSPNMRSFSAALLYPGTCLLEGTNCSEGRGTDTPFEIVGAPYVDSEELVDAFNALGLPGVHAAPTSFIPTQQKWRGNFCNGVRWVVEDVRTFRPYLTGLAFVWLLRKMYGGKGFEWRTAPYEFVTTRPAIDLLTGSALFRERIEQGSLDDLKCLADTPKEMQDERGEALLY